MIEIKTNFKKLEVPMCSDYEECRLRGYDAVWPGINILTWRGEVLCPYHTPERSANFYQNARSDVTANFNINNLSVLIVWFLVNLWLLLTTQM